MTAAGLQLFICSRVAIVYLQQGLQLFGGFRAPNLFRSVSIAVVDAAALRIDCLCNCGTHSRRRRRGSQSLSFCLCLLGTREIAAEPSGDSRVMPQTNCLESS